MGTKNETKMIKHHKVAGRRYYEYALPWESRIDIIHLRVFDVV